MDINGEVALVTGGASGLGLATVKRLVADGASVVLLDLPSSAGVKIADELGDRVRFAAADVTSEEDVTKALDIAVGLGSLRAVVNCAGTGDAIRVLGRKGVYPLDKFARIVSINLIGTFNVLRLAAERIAATDEADGERGVIVNTASAAAFDGQIGQASYSASKAGIVGMALPIARELASVKIRVMTIAPGIFNTPPMAGFTPAVVAALEASVPHPSRMGDPSEFAALVSHIISNAMLNGEVIRLDGAIRMAPK